MKDNLRLFEIELMLFHIIDSPEQVKSGAKFKNKLTQEDYGIQRFITESGEVSVMNLIENGFPEGYADVRRILELVSKIRKKDKNHNGSWIGINDAIRYFADLSPQRRIWYWEYMRILDPVLMNEADVVRQEVITSKNEEVTFNNWLSLSETKKRDYMHEFLNNPIGGKEQITTYVFS